MSSHGLTADGVIAFSDDELVQRTWDAVDEVDERDAELCDALTFLVGELIERFAPDAARAETVRTYTAEFAPDPEDSNDLLDALEGLRRNQAARLLRDAMS